MYADEFKVLAMCVETGVRRGWTRAHKHNDAPDDSQICEAIERAVTDEICEWFLFEADEAEPDATARAACRSPSPSPEGTSR